MIDPIFSLNKTVLDDSVEFWTPFFLIKYNVDLG